MAVKVEISKEDREKNLLGSVMVEFPASYKEAVEKIENGTLDKRIGWDSAAEIYKDAIRNAVIRIRATHIKNPREDAKPRGRRGVVGQVTGE